MKLVEEGFWFSILIVGVMMFRVLSGYSDTETADVIDNFGKWLR